MSTIAGNASPAEVRTVPDPSLIMQVGLGFWASKVLLSAVELGVFGKLAEKPLPLDDLVARLGLHERSAQDFLDALVALGFLERAGVGASASYANTLDTGTFLAPGSPQYMGGILEMANTRLYPFWNDLTEALRTGKPQNESKRTGHGLFEALYDNPDRLQQFMAAMAGLQADNFALLAERFDFSKYRTCCDIGGASGALTIQIARRNPEMRCTTLDLPAVEPIAKKAILDAGLSARIDVVSADFMNDAFPKADVVTMGNLLHDWNAEQKRMLIGKAFDALPPGGAFIAIENVIDDDRRHNAFGLLMSLNMLIETEGGFDYTGAQFDRWCRATGFAVTKIMPLAGPSSAAIAFK